MRERAGAPTESLSHITSQIDCTLNYALDGPCDFIFLIQAMIGMGQIVLCESIEIDPPIVYRPFERQPPDALACSCRGTGPALSRNGPSAYRSP